MVSFSCEGCGDVLTKKKLDPHRNQCWGATYTCLDCMTHFPGTSYRSHTSCISEDQKYQGKLYREKKPKGQHNQQNNSQALVQTQNAYTQDETENAVAVVDAPPRAPTPPPAAKSLGHQERAALPAVNVFDFLDTSAMPADETRMIEDSIPPPYEYGNGTVYATQETPDPSFTTPAPKKAKKSKDVDTTTSKSDRKRKRNSPSELDMDAVRQQQAQDRDVTMADAPMLHSGLTGGLNRLLARPEFPPSPELSGDRMENSPLSPMKRAKQDHSKAFLRAQKDWDKSEKSEKKEKERGRGKERKSEKKEKSSKKKRDSSRKARDSDRRRKRAYSSSASPEPGVKAIEYNKSASETNGALIVRPNGDLVAAKTGEESRAELFLSFVKTDSDRGMSVNKALKRYHREQSHTSRFNKADEEKELWKSLRLKKNDRGEIVVFFGASAGVDE